MKNMATSNAQLKQSEPQISLLQGIIEGLGDISAAFDMNFCYLAFNHAYQQEFERIFGRQVNIGDSLIEMLAHLPEDQMAAVALVSRALQGEAFTLVEPYGDSRRSRNHYDLTFTPLRDEKNQLIGTILVGRDVTRRVQAEKALEESEKRFRAIFNNTFQFTGLLSPDGTLLEANEASLEAVFKVGLRCEPSEHAVTIGGKYIRLAGLNE